MPSALAASAWPRGTELMPARMISAMYPASQSDSATTAEKNGVMKSFVRTEKACRRRAA